MTPEEEFNDIREYLEKLDNYYIRYPQKDRMIKFLFVTCQRRGEEIEKLKMEISNLRDCGSHDRVDLNDRIFQLECGILKYKEVTEKQHQRISELESRIKELEFAEKILAKLNAILIMKHGDIFNIDDKAPSWDWVIEKLDEVLEKKGGDKQ